MLVLLCSVRYCVSHQQHSSSVLQIAGVLRQDYRNAGRETMESAQSEPLDEVWEDAYVAMLCSSFKILDVEIAVNGVDRSALSSLA
jgi:hypothetical protein